MSPQQTHSHSEHAGHSQSKPDGRSCFGTRENSFSGATETRHVEVQTELSGDQLMDSAAGANKLRKIMQVLFGGTSEVRTQETQTNKSSDQQTEPWWRNYDIFEKKKSSGGARESSTQATQTDTSSDGPMEMETDGQNEDDLSRAKASHVGSKGNGFQEMEDKKSRDPATQEKIDELNFELKNLMDVDSSHTPGLVQLLIDHVKQHRNVILSTKSYQEKTGLSISTESAASETIEATPNDDREDENQPCELKPDVPTTHNTTSVPTRPANSSLSSMSWTPSVCTIFPLQTHVVGQAFFSEQQFLNQVEKHLERWEIYLEKEPFAPTSHRLLLLFCPVMSRAGTDISHALEKIPAQVRVILVVMNHVPIENSTVYLDSRSQVQRSSVIHTVDCRFSQRSGLYSTEINKEAVLSVAQKIKQEATLPSIKS